MNEGILAKVQSGWGANVRRFCELKVGRWAAILVSGVDGRPESFGHALDENALPTAMRRRMGRLEKLAACCALGVLDDIPTGELIFCSRHGNLETLSSLLGGLAEEQLMSPMQFSGSVHNATPGLVGQIRKERLSHTALAAGPNTLRAGLIESAARLANGDESDVTLIFADMALPEFYREFGDEEAPGIAMAVRLQRAEPDDGVETISAGQGRLGALELLDALRKGPVRLAVGETACLAAT